MSNSRYWTNLPWKGAEAGSSYVEQESSVSEKGRRKKRQAYSGDEKRWAAWGENADMSMKTKGEYKEVQEPFVFLLLL